MAGVVDAMNVGKGRKSEDGYGEEDGEGDGRVEESGRWVEERHSCWNARLA